MLEIQNVSKTFNAGTVNEKTALNGLNLKLNEGDFVTVIGGNGAGKSTMLNAVAGVPLELGALIGVVAAVALVMLFWAVIRVFGSIESAFNNIWEVKVERGITRQWTDYIAVVMIVPILWIVANAVGNYAEQLLGFDDSWYFNLLSHLASMIVIWVMFTFLYIVIPNARVRFGSALMAGIVAGTIFLLFQWGYVYVQRWMTSYNAIYGSFAALPLLLIWMQTSWEILLFGGELSFAYQNIRKFEFEKTAGEMSLEYRKKALLVIMHQIVKHFMAGRSAMSSE